MSENLKREDGLLLEEADLANGDLEVRAYEINGQIRTYWWFRTTRDWFLDSTYARVIGTRAEVAAMAKHFPVEEPKT